jgi:hypothetical protein
MTADEIPPRGQNSLNATQLRKKMFKAPVTMFLPAKQNDGKAHNHGDQTLL